MTEYSLRLAKPHCENCHKSKFNEMKIVGQELLKQNQELSLADRLQQTINQAKPEEEEEI